MMMRRKFYKLLTATFCLGSVVTASAAPSAPVKVACIGDSITFGARINDREKNCYPAQLGGILGDRYEVRNFGVSGATLLKKGNKPYWKQKAYKQALAFNPDVVVIKLGTNDSKPGNWTHQADYVSDYVELIKSFQTLESKPTVWICYPVPAYPGNFKITDQVIKNEVLPQIDEVSKQASVQIIDLYKALSGQKALFPDKVHPNAAGAKIMAETIAEIISHPDENSIDGTWPGTISSFHSFNQYAFKMGELDCKVVVPQEIAEGTPWIWRARFFGHEPQLDIALLNRGYHVAYVEVGGLFGSPEAVERWNLFYEYLTQKRGFNSKPVLEGMSRGGLIVYNWAIANPDKVSCIYADAPVCDFKSWPGGKGKGKGASNTWKTCLKAYGMSEDEALNYAGNPVDQLKSLAAAGVPLLHVVGDADDIVPVAENTAIVESRYKAMGGSIAVIHKKDVGHHPHSLKDPSAIIEFIQLHAGK